MTIPREGGASFSRDNRVFRLIWNITWRLFVSWTPGSFGFWRRFIFRLFGAKMAASSDVKGSARVWHPGNLIMEERTIIADNVWCYNMDLVTLRAGAVVSQSATLCAGTHLVDDPTLPLVLKPIEIGLEAWIAAEAFVGPGVLVGDGAVLGARAVTFRDLDSWSIYVGNPAQFLRRRESFDLKEPGMKVE